MEPQPIETAPKDCTPLIGLCIREYPSGEKYWEGATMQWEGGPGRVLKGCWAYSGLLVRFVDDEYEPTHWLPLTEPPQ